jgi:hypothetical protein
MPYEVCFFSSDETVMLTIGNIRTDVEISFRREAANKSRIFNALVLMPTIPEVSPLATFLLHLRRKGEPS